MQRLIFLMKDCIQTGETYLGDSIRTPTSSSSYGPLILQCPNVRGVSEEPLGAERGLYSRPHSVCCTPYSCSFSRLCSYVIKNYVINVAGIYMQKL